MKALLLLAFPVFLLVTSCTAVRSKQLVGKTKVDLSQEDGEASLSAIAGEWVNIEGDVTPFVVTNAKEGQVRCGPVDDDDSFTMTLRKSGEHIFANFPPDEKGERVWLLMKARGETEELIFWAPDVAIFRDLIAKGKIKGTNDPESKKDKNGKERKNQSPGAVIDDPGGEWVEKVVAGEFGVVFNWQDPLVLRKKVAGKDSPDSENGGEGTKGPVIPATDE